MLITPDQCRAARALIRWSRKDLAEAAGVTERTVTDFERWAEDGQGNVREPRKSTLLAIRAALKDAGVVFVDPNGAGTSDGVRLRQLIWKLTPLDLESHNWRASTYKGQVIIRAATEDRARRIASMAFGIAVKRVLGETTAINPWGRIIGESSCERLVDSAYPEDGPDEILDPAEYNHEWQRYG